MSKLKEVDFLDLLSVILVALECDQVQELRIKALEHLEKIFRSDKSGFFLASECKNELNYEGAVTRNVDRTTMEKYAKYFHRLDPFLPNMLYRPVVVVTEQIISYKSLVQTEYYNDFLKPESMYHWMGITIKSNRSLIGALSFFRQRNRLSFSSQDKYKAELIAPCLTEILTKNILLSRQTETAEPFESLTTVLPYQGIIVLDEFLEPIHIDANAKKIISLINQREKCQKGSYPPVPEELYQLCHELRKTASLEASLKSRQLQFNLDIGQGHHISACARLCIEPNRPLSFLIWLRSNNPRISFNASLRKLGFTPRLLEVGYLVSQGLKNAEIADKLCISKYTVENHIKSIYNKLGVSNRSRLVRQLIGFS